MGVHAICKIPLQGVSDAAPENRPVRIGDEVPGRRCAWLQGLVPGIKLASVKGLLCNARG